MRKMKARRMWIPLGTVAGLCLVTVAVLYCRALKAQHEATAFLKILSEVRFGITTRDEFTQTMMKFKDFDPSVVSSSCEGGTCLAGPSYGIDNNTFHKYFLIPPTVLAVGVLFDSNNIAQRASITLVRYRMDQSLVAIATFDVQPESTPGDVTLPAHWTDAPKLHFHIDNSHRQDLTRLRVSCFTSWLGCDTAQALVSGEPIR
jgi:hypothetical protein